jgi:hypothetical protein
MIRFLGIKVTFNIIESLGIGYVSKAEVNDCRASVCSRELFLNQFVLKTYSKIAVTQISSSQGGFVPTTDPTHMKVDIQVQRTAKPLDQRNYPSAGCLFRIACLLDQLHGDALPESA